MMKYSILMQMVPAKIKAQFDVQSMCTGQEKTYEQMSRVLVDLGNKQTSVGKSVDDMDTDPCGRESEELVRNQWADAEWAKWIVDPTE